MSRSNTDHCVMDFKTQEFVCKRCGERFLPPLPMPINQYVMLSEAFSQKHRACTTSKRETQ